MSRTIIINEAQLALIEKLVKETTPLMNNGTTKETFKISKEKFNK